MTWYRTGTVTLANNSSTVIGTGTAFVANVMTGQEFRLQDGNAGIEIANIDSDTELTLARPYVGAPKSGEPYEIAPIKGYNRSAYDALQQVLAQWTAYVDGPLSGVFPDGDAAAPALCFPNDRDTGLYRAAANALGVAAAGQLVALINAQGLNAVLGATTPENATVEDLIAGRLLIRTNVAGTTSDLSLASNAVISGETSISQTLSEPSGFWRYMRDAIDNASGTSGATEVARLGMDGVWTVNGNATLQTSVVIANDAVATIAVPRQGCCALIICGGTSDNVQNLASGFVQLDTGSSPAQNLIYGRANFSAMATPLTGTTGAANGVAVHANDDGTFQIENRRGAPYTFMITVI